MMILFRKISLSVRVAALSVAIILPLTTLALDSGFTATRLIEASPDERFDPENIGLGSIYDYAIDENGRKTGGLTEAEILECLNAGKLPKINQAYPWGMTKAGDCLWIGTGANVSILASVAYSFGAGALEPVISTDRMSNPTRVAEYQESAFAREGLVPAARYGDWRPPDIFVYDLTAESAVRRDLNLPGVNDKFFPEDNNPDEPVDLLWDCQGLRSAGASDSVVFLAGPSLTVLDGGGIIMFAFNAETKTLIEARRFPEYNNIRKWLFHNGALYTTVGLTEGDGAVLRWTGTVEDPFQFEIAGNLDNAGAELAIHDDCLFVATWPFSEGINLENPKILEILTGAVFKPAGIWKSPTVQEGGLTAAHAESWTKVWNMRDYEPDFIVSAAAGVGSLASFGEYLVWGTMHPMGAAAGAYGALFPQANADFPQVQRATSIFRGRNFGTSGQEVELLYGESHLPTYKLFEDTWTLQRNHMNMDPLYGSSGFGNAYNIYCWNALVHKDQLYIGTLEVPFGVPSDGFGANFYCFASINAPGQLIEGEGFGESSTSGNRTLVGDSNALYLGMANGSNLRYNTPDGQTGGWEVIELIKKDFGEADERQPNGDEMISDTRRPLFRWCSVPGVSTYRFKLYLEGDLCLSTTVDEAFFMPVSDLHGGDYSWNVTPCDDPSPIHQEPATFTISGCETLTVTGLSAQDASPASDAVAIKVAPAGCGSWTELSIRKKGQSRTWLKEWFKPGLDPSNPFGPPAPPSVTHMVYEHDLGEYTVRARLWNKDLGLGPWSDPTTYFVGKIDGIHNEEQNIFWNNASVAHANWFYIVIKDERGRTKLRKWVRKSQTTLEGADRSYTLSGRNELDPGTYNIWILTRTRTSTGPWSDAAEIIISAEPR